MDRCNRCVSRQAPLARGRPRARVAVNFGNFRGVAGWRGPPQCCSFGASLKRGKPMKRTSALALAVAALFASSAAPAPAPASYTVLIRGGTIYDGSGGDPYVGDVALKGDKIVYVGPHAPDSAARVIDATGKAVSPGFINMLSWAVESLIAEGRGMSDTYQGVTLEVFGEGDSMGPLNPEMKRLAAKRQGDIKYPIKWTTLGQYLAYLQRKGVTPNVASFVGATTVRA